MADYVTRPAGGHGAAREVAERILKAQKNGSARQGNMPREIMNVASNLRPDPRFCLALCLLLALVIEARAQLAGFSVSDVSVPIYEKGRLKALFTGKTAKPQKNGHVLITRFGMETFRNGDRNQKELIVEAPECSFDSTNHNASSPGRLKVQAADGRFLIEGEGFEWRQAEGRLVISNRVQTVLRKDLLVSASTTNGAPANPSDDAPQDLEIFSDHFDFDSKSGLARYIENVRATDPERMKLACGRATVQLPPAGGRVESILAEEDVIIDLKDKQGDTHATGARVVYAIAQDGRVSLELTGDPGWETKDYAGRGDLLFLAPGRKEFKAKGHAWLRLPLNALNPTNALAAKPALAANGLATTNHFLEIFSDSHEFETNSASFHGGVRVQNEPEWNLTCGNMTARLAATGGRVETIRAEENVLIVFHEQDGESQAAGDQAVYTITSGGIEQVELAGHPSWKTKQYEGKGEVLFLYPRRKEFSARREAVLKLLPQPVAQPGIDGLPRASRTNAPVLSDQPVDIFSDNYDFKAGEANFRGHVRVEHPEWELTCGSVKVTLTPEGHQIKTIEAEEKVTAFEVRSRQPVVGAAAPLAAPKGWVTSTNAPWQLKCDRMTLKMNAQGKQIERIDAWENVIFEQGATVATGEQAEYTFVNQHIRLSGNPTLMTADGKKITGATVLILDRKSNSFEAEGPYKVEISDKALRQPRPKASK